MSRSTAAAVVGSLNFTSHLEGTKRLRVTRMGRVGKMAVFHAAKAELEEKERRILLFCGRVNSGYSGG